MSDNTIIDQASKSRTGLPGIRFSIIIATYNQEGFIREAVASALAQDHPAKEIIVVDDNSSDGTADVVRTFGDSVHLEILAENSGVYESRNRGASLAKGEYLVFLDGDDVLMPWTLNVYDCFISKLSPTIILGKPVLFRGDIPEIKEADIPNRVSFVEYADFFSKDRPGIYNTSALVVNRTAFWSAGGWTNGIFYQDIQDLLTKMGVSGKMIIIIKPGTVWYRMHPGNAITRVPSFADGIYKLLENEKAGLYPGGKNRRIERASWFGGLIFYWLGQLFHNGYYKAGFRLFAKGWWMILLALTRRAIVCMRGRRPIDQLKLKQ